MEKINNPFTGKFHVHPYKDISDDAEKKNVRRTFKGTFPQLLAAISGTLFALSDGMTYGWTAPYIPYLVSEVSHIKTTLEEAEWLETALMCGALCALPLTMFLVNTVGRKKSLLISSFLMSISWIIVALGNTMVYLFVARFLSGVCGNLAFVAAPMFVAEIAEQKIRGLLSSIIQIMAHIGSLTVYCVGPFFPFYVTPIIGGCIVLLELLIFSSVPESPHFLLYKNKPEKARKSLEYFRPGRDIEKELRDISESVEIQKHTKGSISDLLLAKGNRKALLIMVVLNSGQHLCAYTVILMNLHSILETAGSIYMDSSIAAILFAALMLVAVTFASFQIDKYGRKVLLIFSSIITGICLLTLAVYFNLKMLKYDILSVSWIPLVSVMIYAAAFKTGLGIVPIVITAEIFPAKFKTICVTISDGMFLLGGIIAIHIYQFLSKLYGMHVPFYLFAFWSFSMTIFTVFYMPETKGKSLEEIQTILSYQTLEEDEDL